MFPTRCRKLSKDFAGRHPAGVGGPNLVAWYLPMASIMMTIAGVLPTLGHPRKHEREVHEEGVEQRQHALGDEGLEGAQTSELWLRASQRLEYQSRL